MRDQNELKSKFLKFSLVALFTAFCFVVAEPVAQASFGQDVLNDAASPVTTDAAPYLYVGIGLSIGLAIFEDQIGDPLQAAATRSRPLGQVATRAGDLAGNMIPNAAYALGMMAYSLAADDSPAKDRAVHMTKASIYSVIACDILKFAVQEPRPDGSDRLSYPSGHTTSAFSFASVIATEHPWYLGALAYTYATMVAYSRMNDNRHFLHDLVAGAAIGLSYGLALRKTPNSSSSAVSLRLLPTDDLGGAAAVFAAQF